MHNICVDIICRVCFTMLNKKFMIKNSYVSTGHYSALKKCINDDCIKWCLGPLLEHIFF